MSEGWLFSDSENLAVITLKSIVREGSPILHVVHDADDEGWQFLGWADAEVDDAMVVALQTMVQLDPSVQELTDLLVGWHAWRRTPDAPWERSRNGGGSESNA